MYQNVDILNFTAHERIHTLIQWTKVPIFETENNVIYTALELATAWIPYLLQFSAHPNVLIKTEKFW